MKKFFVGLIVLVSLISFAIVGGSIPEASGEDITFHRVLPVEQNWISSDGAPVYAVANDDYTVVFVDGNMVAIPTDETKQRQIVTCPSGTETPRFAHVYGDYVFVKYVGSTSLYVYSLSTLNCVESDGFFPLYVTANGDKLYLAFLNGSTGYIDVREYDLSQEFEIDFSTPVSESNFFPSTGTISTGLDILSVRDVAVTDDALYYVSIRGEISALYLSGQKSSFLMNDMNYDSVTVAGNVVVGLSISKDAEGNSNGAIRAVDAVNGTTLSFPSGDEESSVVTPTSVSSLGDLLFVCDSASESVKVFNVTRSTEGASVAFVRSIAGKGSGNGRLNTPSDLYCNDKIYVADTENNRILIKDGDQTRIETGFNAPFAITEWQTNIYVADADGVKLLTSGGAPTTIYESTSVHSISATNDYLFVSENTEEKGGVVQRIKKNANSGEFSVEPFFGEDNDENAEKIVLLSSHAKGASLVVFTESRLHVYFGDGTFQFANTLSSLGLSHNGENNLLLEARSTSYGDLFVMTSQNDAVLLKHLTRARSSFVEDDSATTLPKEFSGFAFLNDGTVMFSSKATHSLFEMHGSTIKTEAKTYYPPTLHYHKVPVDSPLFVFRAKTDTYFFLSPYNYESVIPVEAGENLLVLYNHSVSPNSSAYYYYVYRDGVLGYVPASDLEVLPIGTLPSLQYKYVNKNYTDKLYKYPIEDETYVIETISKHSELEPLNTVSDYDNASWYCVKYEGAHYYIKRVHVDIETPPAPTIYYYAKIQSASLGTTVNVYTLPDVNSYVKGTLTDGVEVKLVSELNPADTYTYVVCGDVEGYVLTMHLITGGLTSAQVTGLVLVGVAGVTSTAILVINKLLRRKKDE